MKIHCLFSILVVLVSLPSFGQIPQNEAKDSLNNLANYYLEKSEIVFQKDLDSCLFYTKEAKDLFRVAQNWPQYVNTLSGLSGAYYYQGNFELALQFNKKAIQEAKRYLGEGAAAYGNTLVAQGVLQDKKGELDAAIRSFKQSLDLAEKHQITGVRYISILYNLSSVYRRKGDYTRSLQYLEQILDYSNQLENESEQERFRLRSYYEIGICYKWMQRFRSALNFFLKANAILERKPSGDLYDQRRIDVFINMGESYQSLGALDSTMFYARQALKFQKLNTVYLKERSYTLLAEVELKKKNFAEALSFYEEAYEISLQQFEQYKRHPIIASSLANIAKAYATQKDYPAALNFHQQALIQLSRNFEDTTIASNPANEELMDKLEGIKIFRAKAAILSKYHQQTQIPELLHQAHATHLQLAELIALVRRSYREEESKYYLAEAAAEIYEEAIETALLLHQQQADPRYLQAAFTFAERNKATLLQESIQARLASGLADTPDSLLAQERQYKTAISFYEREIAAQASQKDGGDAAKVKLWKEQLFDAKQAYEKVEQQLLAEDSRYRELKRQEQLVDIPSLQQQLGQQGRALVAYFYGQRQVYAFLLSPEVVEAYPLGPPETITAAVQQLRRLSSRPPDSRTFAAEYEQFQALATDLYQRLLAPLQAAIPEGSTRLGIVPDDVLNYLPFDLLLMEESKAGAASFSPQQNAYLFDRYTLSYAYSASLSTAAARSGEAAVGFLGFAPNFGDIVSTERSCSANELSALLCNEEEIQSISALFSGQTFVEGQATKAQFEALSGRYQILHLATHACLDAEGGKLNKIFFADDYLSNFELANLDLKADLVVLSACNTGTGQLIRGEGVLSLARGFTIAGCPGTLMSLWAVDDCSTSRLMLRLYEQLRAGQPKDKALRQARLQFLTESDEEHRHPYYWAAFVQFGNIEALSQVGKTGPLWYIWVLAGVLILIALYRVFK
ncbi:MAG: CHAT domain-containing tetratricopeptide repeat protein [Bacteroidota bacterium]